MILSNVYNIKEDRNQFILVENGIIAEISRNKISTEQTKAMINLEFDEAIVFPGLINSHDHLDFNLYPQLGNRVYNNYTEWGKDIHKQNKNLIDKVSKVPQALRTRWGLYKNLLNGVTTVVNHGERLTITNDLITVFQDCYSLHSIHFENNWKYKLNRLFAKKGSYVIHVGEGTDLAASEEIDRLIKWNLFRRKLVGVHGVAMNEKQSALFHALVWCPASNYFLLNRTSPVNQLKKYTDIIFGTDSTLTAGWNAWDQLRLARSTQLLTDTGLMNAVSDIAGIVWGLNAGLIEKNKNADLVVARKKPGLLGNDLFFAVNPEDLLLVMHAGMIKLFDDSLKTQLLNQGMDLSNFSFVHLNDSVKYVRGDLPELMKDILAAAPDTVFPIPLS